MVIKEVTYKCDFCQCSNQDDIVGVKYYRDSPLHLAALRQVSKEEAEHHLCTHCLFDIKESGVFNGICYHCGIALKEGEKTWCTHCSQEYHHLIKDSTAEDPFEKDLYIGGDKENEKNITSRR